MSDKIVLKEIEVKKNIVNFNYIIPDNLKHFFNPDMNFFYEYPDNFDFSNVPESVLAIPFAMNFMTFAWINGCTVEVDEIDEAFFNSLPDILNGIKRIYPNIEFNGKLSAKKIIKNEYKVSDNTTVLFSGGVDAVSTFVSHADEKPVLINIWGADIKLDDYENHNIFERDLQEFASNFDEEFFFIRSSLRWTFLEPELQRAYMGIMKDTWWHGMQHGLGMLSLLAPYNYQNKTKTNYIASSFTENDIGIIIGIAYPFIDNNLKMMNTSCFHDGFEYNRLEKLKNIISYSKKNNIDINLKVCFYPKNGNNCCKCEKCLRTAALIIALGGDIRNYGFNMDNSEAVKRIKHLCDNSIISDNTIMSWKECRAYLENSSQATELDWMKGYTFNTYKPSLYRKTRIILGKIKRKIIKK